MSIDFLSVLVSLSSSGALGSGIDGVEGRRVPTNASHSLRQYYHDHLQLNNHNREREREREGRNEGEEKRRRRRKKIVEKKRNKVVMMIMVKMERKGKAHIYKEFPRYLYLSHKHQQQ